MDEYRDGRFAGDIRYVLRSAAWPRDDAPPEMERVMQQWVPRPAGGQWEDVPVMEEF